MHRESILDQLRARVFASALDRKLASGTPAHADPALSLRARALTRPAVRDRLGKQLRRIVREAHEPPGPSTPVRACRKRVVAAEDELRLLASRLQSPLPVTVLGLAKVQTLLGDGSGPLYHRGSVVDLGLEIRRATAALS